MALRLASLRARRSAVRVPRLAARATRGKFVDLVLWNVALTGALTLVSWFAKTMWAEQQRLNILLNRTREEVARDYVTKAEVHADINRVMHRLEQLDSKLDRLMER